MTNSSESKWRTEVEASFVKAWPVFITACLFNIVFTLRHMLMDPVLRSFIKCDEAGGEIFSGSSFCGDKKYVVQSAVRQSAMLSATEGIMSMFVVPVIGAVSDRHGRLPALRTSILATFLFLLLNLVSQDVIALRFLAFACSSASAAFFPTFHAILGDCGGNRSVSFTVKIIFANAGQLIGWIVGVAILRQEFVDYTFMWVALLTIFSFGSVVACRIEESRPVGLNPASSSPNVFAALYFAIQNPFLLRWCIAKFLALFGLSVMSLLKSFVLSAYDWRQGTLEGAMGVFFMISATSTLAGPWFVDRYSVETVVERCTLMGAISLSMLLFAPLGSLFCAFAAFLQAAGACTIAASSALLAERFTEDQGKAQSVVVAIAGGASNLGSLLYSSLYDAKAEGVSQAQPFAVAMVMGWAAYCTLLSALESPSASPMPGRQVAIQVEETRLFQPDDPKSVVMGRRHSFDLEDRKSVV